MEKQTHIDNFLYFSYIFLYLKKNSVNFRKKKFYIWKKSVEIRLVFEKKKSKKILKIIFAIFLFKKKNSVNSRLIYQSKDRKLSVKMSVNLGYFRWKHRLHNLPGGTNNSICFLFVFESSMEWRFCFLKKVIFTKITTKFA